MTITQIDIDNLPAPEVVEALDFEALLAADYPRIPPPTPQSVALGETLAAAFLGPSGEVAAVPAAHG